MGIVLGNSAAVAASAEGPRGRSSRGHGNGGVSCAARNPRISCPRRLRKLSRWPTRLRSGMEDGEEFSKIAQTRLEAGFIALDEAGLFANGWVKEPVVLHHLARIGVYSPELCGDEAALSKAFAADVQRRFRTERRGLLGFKRRGGVEFVDAKGSRVTKHMLEQLHDVGQLARWPQMGLGRVGMKNSPESMTEGAPVLAPQTASPLGWQAFPTHGLPCLSTCPLPTACQLGFWSTPDLSLRR